MLSWDLIGVLLALLAFAGAWVALRGRPRSMARDMLRLVTGVALVSALALLSWPAPLHAPGLPPTPLASRYDPAGATVGAQDSPTTTRSVAEAKPTEVPAPEETVPTETVVARNEHHDGPSRNGPGEDDHPTIPGLHGALQEGSFPSAALGRIMPYMLYLPPHYDSSQQAYPVLYLLHGRGGARNQLITGGFLDAADAGMLAESIAPMLIVFPEGGNGYWTNHANNGPRWGDYVTQDLVAHIDASYRTLPRSASRAIGGISMGGWGALHHAFTAPQVFGVVGAHSPALRPDDGSLDFLGRGPAYALRDPLSLARTLPVTAGLQIWIDTGQDDPWASRSALLHDTLTQRGIVHAWHLGLGGHDWDYWGAHVGEYLSFYSRALTH